MRKLFGVAAVVLAFVVVLAFFLPWAHVESQEMGMISKVLTGKAQANIASVSGYGIPRMANSDDSRLAISVIKIFNPDIKDAHKKSYLVWLMPILAIAAAFTLAAFANNKWVNLVIGVVCALVFVLGVYKIASTDMNKLVLNVRIGAGLWLTLYGYLGMGLAGIAGFVSSQLKKS